MANEGIIKKSTSELDLLPEFTTVKIKADKTAIKQAIKNGQKIAGAYLVESINCIIK